MWAIGRAGGKGAGATFALLAVLMLLAVPALAGRAHAAMPSIEMGQMGAPEAALAAAPTHHDAAGATCVVACALAAQLLPAPTPVGPVRPRADAPVRYFAEAPRLAGVAEEPGAPPPR